MEHGCGFGFDVIFFLVFFGLVVNFCDTKNHYNNRTFRKTTTSTKQIFLSDLELFRQYKFEIFKFAFVINVVSRNYF